MGLRRISTAALTRTIALFSVALFVCATGRHSHSSIRASADSQLIITTNFNERDSIGPDDALELNFSRRLEPADGTLSIVVGDIDLTFLFVTTEKGLKYTPAILPLPLGASTVNVYLVSDQNVWKQVAQFTLHVKARDANGSNGNGSSVRPAQVADGKNRRWGFDAFEFKPSLTVDIRSEAALSYYPDANRPQRINFTDFALQGTIQTKLARGAWSSQNQFDFVGTSNQLQALRAGDRGLRAPQIDLSSYTSQLQIGKVKATLGHSSFGTNRYLINSFSSRGLNVTIPVHQRADFSFSAMNGTSIVGWSNFTGLQQQNHKVAAGTFGFEFLPKRPGGVRLEVGAMAGSLLPLTNVNQANLTDRQRSNGFGARVLASDKQGRFKVDAGVGRSRFGNPTDPLLNQGFTVVPVRDVAKNAEYIDLSYQALNSAKLIKDRPVSLSFAFHHNRVDPQFRSVALNAQADRLDNQFELSTAIGEITFAAVHNRADDNLDNIRSVLKTLTRRNGINAVLPLTAILGAKETYSKWLPRLSYNYDHTHNYGAFLPVGAGFTDSHVPNQASTNQTFSAELPIEKWRLSYRFNESFQDNRQIGREPADLRNLANTIGVGFTPGQRFNVNLDLSSERQHNLERAEFEHNFRVGLQFNVQTTRKSMLAATISSAFAGDALNKKNSRNADLDLQWSTRFSFCEHEHWRKIEGQFFIRYANRYASARDNVLFFNHLTKAQTFSAGLSFTFF